MAGCGVGVRVVNSFVRQQIINRERKGMGRGGEHGMDRWICESVNEA